MNIEQWIATKMRADSGLRERVMHCIDLAASDKEQAARLLADDLLESAGVDQTDSFSADSIVSAMVRDACSALDWDRIAWCVWA